MIINFHLWVKVLYNYVSVNRDGSQNEEGIIHVEESKLGDEQYKLVTFAIFGLALFPFKSGVISFRRCKCVRGIWIWSNQPIYCNLVETMLSLNHYRMLGKGAMRCCVLILHLWTISHIKTPRDIFNNFRQFDLLPLKIIIYETWKNLDEKVWVEKIYYITVKQLQMENTIDERCSLYNELW
jgi:hypothetical protein